MSAMLGGIVPMLMENTHASIASELANAHILLHLVVIEYHHVQTIQLQLLSSYHLGLGGGTRHILGTCAAHCCSKATIQLEHCKLVKEALDPCWVYMYCPSIPPE
jgi:hypothetical protein